MSMWQEVESSNIQAAQWRNGNLLLRFHRRNKVSGMHRVYLYEKVPERVFSELVSAESVGEYFNAHILGFYVPIEVTGIPLDIF